MVFSMTGYGVATRALMPEKDAASGGEAAAHATTVAVEIRTVNSRFLDLHFRMPDEVRASESPLRDSLMATLGRGKVEVRVNVQHAAQVAGGAADPQALSQLSRLQLHALAAFPDATPLSVADILRWPGILADQSVAGEPLRHAVVEAGREALADVVAARGREGAALSALLSERVADMQAIVDEIAPLIPELVTRHQQKIVERLQHALGLALPAAVETPAEAATAAVPYDEVMERIRQEVTVYAVRIDVAEELARLKAHLAETLRILEKGGRVGKRLDFMMQELNREANTLGSKAAAQELADAAMALKLLIEQMREQVQNLE